MASILWNKGEKSVIDGWLGGQSNYPASPLTIVPTAAGNWGVGLGTRVGGVGSTKANVMAQIGEIGSTTANGYSRRPITRDQTGSGWPAASLSGASYASTAPQVSFTFTGTPNPNGATLWFMAGSTTIGHDNCLFGADTQTTRTFGNGDVERVTPTYQQT